MVRTKIICTIGPSVNNHAMITALVLAGMNIARLNFSHGTHEEHLKVINILKQVRAELKVPLAIMLDTKGPEIRLRKLKGGEVKLNTGDLWRLVKEDIEGDESRVSITPSYILDKLKPGLRVLFDDGYISSKIVEIAEDGVVVEIENPGIVRSGKGVNIPNSQLDLPAFTERDIEDIRFGCKNDIDIIAASFVRSVDHVLAIKRLLDEEKRGDILVIAKIENSEGVQNFDSIVQVADGIMIARGDLGVEVPLSQVPKLQKMMIRKSYLAGKPSVTATQMLESMINNPRPTRAEASDVANAIYDSTSAVMLSGETAIGRYPLETVRVMISIVKEAEEDFDYRTFFDFHSKFVYHDVPSALTLAAVKTAYSSNAKAIFAFTNSGTTARLLARLRPSMPIIAMTSNERSYHQMVFNWGVIPLLSKESTSLAQAFDVISAYGIEQHIIANGDLVVVTAGSPFGISGTTNMMLVESIGDVLVRGESGVGNRIHGNVSLVLSPDSKEPYAVRGQLLLLARCDETYLPLIKESAGVILQNHIDDSESEKFVLKVVQELDKTAIVRADGATRILKEGQLVTLDPVKALIYKGVVI
ncbi:MAG TPA: pyruvate kinase [Parachlamydiaceae bacterium]|nr:pyruvate kinase [Parachlamydiaceae bacterium]